MAWRLAASLTQAELACSIRDLAAESGSPCSPSTPSCQQISRWENGHDKPGAFYQALLARWYRTDLTRLGLIGDVRLAALEDLHADAAGCEDDVDRRGFLAATAVPALFRLDQIRRRMDADLRHVLPTADVERWAQIADEHVAAYGVMLSGELLQQLVPDLAELADLVGQYPGQRELTRLAARLSGLTGALYTDLGEDRAARDWLFTAGRYAAMSGDLATEYWIAMAQAMAAAYPLLPQRLLTIAERAAAELGPHSCSAAAQLAGLAARAHAELGDRSAARAALATAERIAGTLAIAEADEVFFGFPCRQMLMYTSQVLSVIDDPASWDAQAVALAAYPDDDPMDRPLILLGRARQLARRGDADGAAQVALAAIGGLAPAWRVPLLASEARSVGKAIATASAQAGRRYAQLLEEAVPA